jgi:hypothetical protein
MDSEPALQVESDLILEHWDEGWLPCGDAPLADA